MTPLAWEWDTGPLFVVFDLLRWGVRLEIDFRTREVVAELGPLLVVVGGGDDGLP